MTQLPGYCYVGKVCRLRFKNMAYGVITAIKFNAQGFNSFGDTIKINNKEKFYLVIQDIRINKNDQANDLSAILPDPNIRQLVLEESQICYEDGSVVTGWPPIIGECP